MLFSKQDMRFAVQGLVILEGFYRREQKRMRSDDTAALAIARRIRQVERTREKFRLVLGLKPTKKAGRA